MKAVILCGSAMNTNRDNLTLYILNPISRKFVWNVFVGQVNQAKHFLKLR